MNRRTFVKLLGALPMTLEASTAFTSGLVDTHTVFSYAYQMHDADQLLSAPRQYIDLNAMLQNGNGYVKLGAGDFACDPVYLRSGDVIQGIGIKTRLWFTQRAFQPADESRATEYVQLRDFDICYANRGTPNQHGLWLAACREWTVDRVRVVNAGGTGAYLYGRRTPAGALDPSDTTRCTFRQFAAWNCRYGILIGGTAGDPVIRGGTSNMNFFERPLSYWAELDAFAILQGAGNVLDMPIAGNSGGDGLRVAWYGNEVRLLVAERNGGYGVRKLRREWSDRTTVTYHSGGSNALGDTNY